MQKLTKHDANQLMEKFSKLEPTDYTLGTPATLKWRHGDREMELSMYVYHTWTMASKRNTGRYRFETVGTLDFEVFPFWQRVRLYFFFKRILRTARAKYWADRNAEKFKQSISTANNILGREDA